MTHSYIYGNYFYLDEIIKMIDVVKSEREKRRLAGETMEVTFADNIFLAARTPAALQSMIADIVAALKPVGLSLSLWKNVNGCLTSLNIFGVKLSLMESAWDKLTDSLCLEPKSLLTATMISKWSTELQKLGDTFGAMRTSS